MIEFARRRSRRHFLRRASTCLIGLDIGSAAIKVAQVRRTGDGWTTGPCRMVYHERPIDGTDPASPLERIADTLRRAWSPSGRWLTDRAACLLPGSLVEFRAFDIPDASSLELHRVVTDELQADGGLTGADWDYGCWSAGRPRSQRQSPRATLSVIAARRSVSDGVAGALRDRGLDCEVIDGLPFALARAVTMDQHPPADCVAAVEWGHQSLSVTCVHGGKPGFTRIVEHCGVGQLIQAATVGLGLEPKDARQILHRYALVPSDELHPESGLEEAVAEICRPVVREFLDELSSTLRYVQDQFPEQAARQILLFGGGGAIRGIDAAVQKVTGIPTRPWSLRSARPNDSSDNVPHPVMAAAISLAALLEESA